MITNLIRLATLVRPLWPSRMPDARHLTPDAGFTLTWVAVFTVVLTLAAGPAMAQSIDLSPIQNLLQGIVDAITGPLGIVIGTLALIGVFLSWLFGILDFRQAMWVLVAIAGVAAAPTIVAAIWGGGDD